MADKRGTLVVVLGAGASFDCANDGLSEVDKGYRPPLVKDLFEMRASFNPILKKYPKASALSGEIRQRIVGKTINLETVLQELSQETSLPIRKQYRQVPLYLQELLGEVTSHFIRFGSTAFDTLVREIERSSYTRVLYITVNYDTFLERALHNLYSSKFRTFDDYVRMNPRWSLFKLHGSVTWGRQVLNDIAHTGNSVARCDAINEELQFGEARILAGYQEESRVIDRKLFYPWLAVPEGGKEDFACPSEHLEHLGREIGQATDMLVIGFSGLDKHVVKLLANAPTSIGRVAIVNGGESNAAETRGRFKEHVRFGAKIQILGSGFDDFVRSNELTQWLG